MAVYISVRDLQYTRVIDGYHITVTTDIACHLYMRWSLIEPQTHSQPRLRRGLFMHTDVYLCFVAYHDNEQEEAGDTLTHTFIKLDWPICQTRYFHFWGEVGGVASVSTSALFKKHRVAVETFTLYPVAAGNETSIHFETPLATPHYLACRHKNTIFDPTWGIWGQFFGTFVEELSWPGGFSMWRDLYHFKELPPITKPIAKITLDAWAGRSRYPYGKIILSLVTYGVLHDSPEQALSARLWSYTNDFPVNPETGNPWTVTEINALQAGIKIGYCASWGHVVCDQLKIVVELEE